jgi:hypothetical protein
MQGKGLRSHPLSERGARRAGCVALLESNLHCWKELATCQPDKNRQSFLNVFLKKQKYSFFFGQY